MKMENSEEELEVEESLGIYAGGGEEE